MPPNGVYAVRVTLNGHRHGGVVNIGTRPTIDPGDRPRRLEVHLLDFEGDLYGQDLEAEFVGWIRDEHAFPDRKALGDQIRRDILTTRRILTTV